MTRVADFTEDQQKFLAWIVSDLGGPTTASALLEIIDRILGEAKPDWELDPSALSPDLREDIDVCMAALQHYEVMQLSSR